MRKLFVAIVFAVTALAPVIAGAQPSPARPADVACTPACRTGYICHQGACVSACNPPCDDNELCRTDIGECVSKCNPVCGAGQQCTTTGACVGGAVVGPGLGGSASAAPADEGWARKAGTLGYISAGVVGALTLAIIIADDPDAGIPIGIAATAVAGVTIPIVSMGGASARRTPGVVGAPGLRLAGWIFYGLSVTDAVVLLGLALSDVEVPPGVVGSVGLLGMSSAVFMSLDAFASANQARALGRPVVGGAARPFVGAVRDRDGLTVPTAGLVWGF